MACGISPEIIDLRCLKPIDIETIGRSVSRTGRLAVFDFSWETCGVGSEIIAQISRHYFNSLKKRPVNISLPECNIPASPILEETFYPAKKELIQKVQEITT